jgi:hypothetical protein
MTPAPDDPRERLTAIIAEIAGRLPREYAILLSAARFAEERQALERLRDPAWAARAAAACGPAEAARLADLAARRWSRLIRPDLRGGPERPGGPGG